jgi:general L-amino acid transport system permease protein
VRFLRVLGQFIFIILLALLAGWLYANVMHSLEARGMRLGFHFLRLEAGFEISEGLEYSPSDSYGKAFLVGVANTLKVSIVGITLATLLGLIAGIARLSSNWLVQKIASVYIETIRNTPLLVQLFFWYTAVLLKLPPVRESLRLPGSIYINQRGLFLPWPHPTAGFKFWGYSLIAAALIAGLVYLFRFRQLKRLERPGFPSIWALPVFVAVAILGWFLAPTTPFGWSIPVLKRFNFEGGLQMTPEFTALLAGLVIYTGAFIAEIVRAGILAVHPGQKEVAKAVGLKNFQILRLVVLPQALRVIIPPLTSQYLNLAKNSSLAVAVGYPDLFNVAGTIFNQTGKAIEVILMIMGSYLIMSLTTSLFMNWYNRRTQLVER